MLLGLQAEGVHVDTLAGHILVVLVRLDQVEVATIALGEAVVAVELQLGLLHRVLAVLEGDGDEHVVGTTSGNTGHGASGEVARVDQGGIGAGPHAVGSEGVVNIVGVVEPLLAELGGSHIRVFLYYPNQLLYGVVKVEFDLGGSAGHALVTSELQLLDQVLMGDLGEAAALISVEVDVINEQGGGLQAFNGLGGGGSAVSSTLPVAVRDLVELEVNLNLVVLYLYTLPFGIF